MIGDVTISSFCLRGTYFKSVESLVWVHLAPGGSEAVICELFDLGKDVALIADVEVGAVLVDVVLELGVAEFVACLELAVVFCFLLDGVIRQVDQPVRKV